MGARGYRFAVLAVILVLVGYAAFLTYGRWQDRNTFQHDIVRAQVAQCNRDQALRHQYKVRGEAEADVLRFAIRLIGPESDPTSRAAVDTFRRDIARIHILPVPDCGALRRHLLATL
jgi:hypothetical protein